MKTKFTTALAALALAFIGQASAQIYDTNNIEVQTFAGYGLPSYIDGQGLLTAFSAPTQIVSDTSSNLYVWDSANFVIRKITPDATVTTFVGNGSSFEGFGTNVSLAWGSIDNLAMDHANRIWLVLGGSFYYNGYYNYLLSIDTNGYVTIENGGLTNLTTSSGLCFDSANNLYYSGGNRIYRYNPVTQVVQPFAGNGVAGNFDGPGTLFSSFNNPTALACDQADNLYVWDSGNGTIRRVDRNQNVATIAGNGRSYPTADGSGTNANFGNSISSMFSDNAGNIYLACGNCVRKMDAQTNVVTLAGVFYNQNTPAFANGPGNQALFSSAIGGCFSQGKIFIADSGNNRIRSITSNPQPQVVPPASLQLKTYPGLQLTGTVGKTYQIQTSPDLNSWSNVTTFLLTSSPYLWVDQNPVNGKKYYRAVMLP